MQDKEGVEEPCGKGEYEHVIVIQYQVSGQHSGRLIQRISYNLISDITHPEKTGPTAFLKTKNLGGSRKRKQEKATKPDPNESTYNAS